MDHKDHSIFISKSVLGNMVLSHDGELLSIRGKRLGEVIRKDIELRNLDPEIRCEFKRYLWRLCGSLLLAFGSAIGLKAMGEPGDELMMPHMSLWMLLLFGFLNAVVWTRRFLFVKFLDRNGNEAFALVCEPLERDQFEHFLAGLIHAIEHPGNVLPEEPAAESESETGVELEGLPRTKSKSSVTYEMPADTTLIDTNTASSGLSFHACFSVFAGFCAVVLPASSRVWEALGGVGVILLLGCSSAALVTGVISFIKKEDMRIYAIYGILMGLAPPFIYT